jgi:hypothetical protein
MGTSQQTAIVEAFRDLYTKSRVKNLSFNELGSKFTWISILNDIGYRHQRAEDGIN